MYELFEIMRQKGDKSFAELLNRVVKVIDTTLILKFVSTLAKLQQHETRVTAHTKARGP